MAVLEIPLDGEDQINASPVTEEINHADEQENKKENEKENEKETDKEMEKENKKEIINTTPDEPPIETIEPDDLPAPKRPRGRPKGTAKPKETATKPAKASKPKAKPKQKTVAYESDDSDTLPEYVRQEVTPPQRDLATQMLQLLQSHENVRTHRKRQVYNSWFSHHY